LYIISNSDWFVKTFLKKIKKIFFEMKEKPANGRFVLGILLQKGKKCDKIDKIKAIEKRN